MKADLENSNIPIRCPSPWCREEMIDADIKNVLSESQYEKYSKFALNRAVQNNADIKFCLTTDCSYIYSLPETDTPTGDEDELDCPICNTRYCLKCEVAYHDGKTCE